MSFSLYSKEAKLFLDVPWWWVAPLGTCWALQPTGALPSPLFPSSSPAVPLGGSQPRGPVPKSSAQVTSPLLTWDPSLGLSSDRPRTQSSGQSVMITEGLLRGGAGGGDAGAALVGGGQVLRG